MAWRMYLCDDSFSHQPTIEMTFDSPEEWRAWLSENRPALMDKDRFSYDGPDYKQQGTNNFWSALKKE